MPQSLENDRARPPSPKSRARRVLVVGVTLVSLAFIGMRGGDWWSAGPAIPRAGAASGVAPVQETGRLLTSTGPAGSTSEMLVDFASLLVLGLSLLGGGHAIGRIRQRAKRRTEPAQPVALSRSPIASTHKISRHVAR